MLAQLEILTTRNTRNYNQQYHAERRTIQSLKTRALAMSQF